MFKLILTLTTVSFGLVIATDIDESTTTTTTPPPPPHPYAFQYTAGRFPGDIDRTHSESSDGSGVVRGSYAYVDPRNQVQHVEYIADRNGFHPILHNAPADHPSDTAVVAAAKQRHLKLYEKIANAHSYGPATASLAAAPKDTVAVQKAKDRHFKLFEKIVQEQARIAAEQEAIRATAEPNTLEYEIIRDD